SCIYPRDCPQPIKEDYLLTGPLEQTNEPYAIAKIAGIKLCESYNRQHGTQYFAAIVGNLLDNAIEASLRTQEGDKTIELFLS
ncbi:NAD-dependent epimerase/dehydratase family protein, partial [Salmonella enterica]|uniref:NAD-dependent epimerase/dehydratase family protein n=1 Tax=Salmonella enterica TaxID=28901 RepID=UPI003F4B5223